MPEYAIALLNELSVDFAAFTSRFEYNSEGANYSNVPILHYLDFDDTAKIFLELFSQCKEDAKGMLKILEKRRAKHREDMKEEWAWIDAFKEASIRKARDRSKLMGAQIEQYFNWFLKVQ